MNQNVKLIYQEDYHQLTCLFDNLYVCDD